VGFPLLHELIDYAERSGIYGLYAIINPDNGVSVKLNLEAGFNVKDWKISSFGIRKF
jgi:L-amino acid N-acyltransferase YncA